MTEKTNATEQKPSAPLLLTNKEMLDQSTTLELQTICRGKEQDLKFYILLDDIHGNRFWQEFDGINKDDVVRQNKIFKMGQEKFADHPCSQEEVRDIRDIVIAISTLAGLFEYSENDTMLLLDNAVVKYAYNVYKKRTGYTDTIQSLETNEEFLSFITVISYYIKEYFEMLGAVKESVEQATVEQAKEGDMPNGK